MIYALRTEEFRRYIRDKMDCYTYKQLREMINPKWETEHWYSPKNELYKQLKQSTMDYWLNKTQVMTMLTQTQMTKTTHEQDFPEMQQILGKLQKMGNNTHQIETERRETNIIEDEAAERNARAGSSSKTASLQKGFAHDRTSSAISQASATIHRIPPELDIARTERKQLAEITLEYPTK